MHSTTWSFSVSHSQQEERFLPVRLVGFATCRHHAQGIVCTFTRPLTWTRNRPITMSALCRQCCGNLDRDGADMHGKMLFRLSEQQHLKIAAVVHDAHSQQPLFCQRRLPPTASGLSSRRFYPWEEALVPEEGIARKHSLHMRIQWGVQEPFDLLPTASSRAFYIEVDLAWCAKRPQGSCVALLLCWQWFDALLSLHIIA
jgi:hypothetical protein